MLRIASAVLASSVAALSWGAEPVLDNGRVSVWDTTQVLPPAQHDYVSISLSRKGIAHFGQHGSAAIARTPSR